MPSALAQYSLEVVSQVPRGQDPAEVTLTGIFQVVDGYQVVTQDNTCTLVFEAVPDAAALSRIVAIIQASAFGRTRPTPAYTVAELAYDGLRHRLPEFDQVRYEKVRGLYLKSECDRIRKQEKQIRSHGRDNCWDDASRYSVSVAFSAGAYFNKTGDQRVRKAMGRSSDSSGLGFGERDMSFAFSRSRALLDAVGRLAQVAFPTRISVSRNVYDHCGFWCAAHPVGRVGSPSTVLKTLEKALV